MSVPRRVEKPWGYEIIWAHTDRYVGKILHVQAGHSLSLQYHEVKDETLYVLSGELKFWAGTSLPELKEIKLRTGQSFRVPPHTIHRIEAVTDVDVLEASTPDLDDVIRLQDEYGRA